MPRNYGSCGTNPSSESLYVNFSADNMNDQQTTLPSGARFAHGRVIPDSQEDEADFNLSRGREIPDSQEDEGDYDLPDSDLGGYLSETDEDDQSKQSKKAFLSSVRQTNNSAIPSFVFRPQLASSLPSTVGAPSVHHDKGINCVGRLAAEHPDNQDMEDIATQPATQPLFDARRSGNNSISEDDAADVICILHPGSKAAYHAVELVARQCPQHILQNDGLELSYDYDTDDQDRATSTRPDAGSQDSLVEEIDTEDTATINPEASTKDIALRMSSKVHNPCLGFTFGRNALKCDIPIVAKDEHMQISNTHFRIYINSSGILMCEDTSTNGTWVDSVELSARDPMIDSQRTINVGSIISLVPDGNQEPIRFIVAIPSRDRQEARYTEKLTEYRANIEELERRALLAAQAAANGNMMAPPPLLPLGQRHQGTARASIPARTFAASTLPFNHGMGWTGGDTYNVVGHIGKGAFANVYKLSTKANGDLIAAKEIDKRKYLKDGILDRKVHNEIEIMQKVNHPNIVQYLGFHETNAHLYVLMEFVHCGDLTPFVVKEDLLPEEDCQSVAYQTIRALDYLHKNNITHRDIKPDNILVQSMQPMFVKLSDFGLSKVVTNDDTFMRTFCGTLLYCAPEVYPGYESIKKGKPPGKRDRHDPQMQTLPYQQSVDTWAFGAVMYHLLCGTPPYIASSEHKGQQMLQSVMSRPVNWDRLLSGGVSTYGCDFVQRMLVHEPRGRAKDAELLGHPWLARFRILNNGDVDMDPQYQGLSAILEDDNELDASQLSLHDQADQVEDGLEYEADGDEDLRISKRLKSDVPRAMGFQPRPNSVQPARDEWDESVYSTFAFYEDPDAILARRHGVPPNNRLFGEIGSSALGSSGVLGQDAHAALDMAVEGSHDESVVMSDDTSMGNTTESHVTNDGISEHSLQYPQLLPTSTYAGPAPSLLGTEALVGQLNMASPGSVASAPSVDSKPGTPRTPRSREISPGIANLAGSKRASEEPEKIIQEEPMKRSKTGRTPDPARYGGGSPHHRDPSIPKDSNASQIPINRILNPDEANHHISKDPSSDHSSKKAHKSHPSHRASSSKPTSDLGNTGDNTEDHHRSHRSSSSKVEYQHKATQMDNVGDAAQKTKATAKSGSGKHVGDKSNEEVRMLTAATGNEDAGEKGSASEGKGSKDEAASSKDATAEGSKAEPGKAKDSQDSQNTANSSNSSSHSTPGGPSPPDDSSFVRPPAILGKLVCVPNSISNSTIKLNQRLNWFGREHDNHHIFPNSLDNRVPRHAIDITFWRSGIERDMTKGLDWQKDPTIGAIISTRTSRFILINGVKLTRGVDCWQYGKLYTGDIITVFDDAADGKKSKDYLKYECIFYVGVAKNKRPEGEPFKVLQERIKFQEFQQSAASGAKRSRTEETDEEREKRKREKQEKKEKEKAEKERKKAEKEKEKEKAKKSAAAAAAGSQGSGPMVVDTSSGSDQTITPASQSGSQSQSQPTAAPMPSTQGSST